MLFTFKASVLQYSIEGNRYRLVRLPHREKFYLITLRARLGDYFFDPNIALTMPIIKEISVITNIENITIKDIASYVVIPHHLLSFAK